MTSPMLRQVDNDFQFLDIVNDNNEIVETESHTGWPILNRLTQKSILRMHNKGVTDLCLSLSGDRIFSVSQDSSLKIYSLKDNRQVRSMKISRLSLSSCGLSESENHVFISSWDNNIYTYSIDSGRIIDTLEAHDSAVSCMRVQKNILVSGSWDSTVKVWNIRSSNIEKLPISIFEDRESQVTCLDINCRDENVNIIAYGYEDGVICIGDLRSNSKINEIDAHKDLVKDLRFTPDGRLVTVGKDHCLKVWNIEGQEIFNIDLSEVLNSIYTNGEQLLIGGEDGILRLWNLFTGEETNQYKTEISTPLNCIVATSEFVATGYESGMIVVWGPQTEENDENKEENKNV